MGETRQFKFSVHIENWRVLAQAWYITPEGMCLGSRDLFRFWQNNWYISETVLDNGKTNRKSCMTYRMEPIPMILGDLGYHLNVTVAVWNLCKSHTSENVTCTLCLHMNRNVISTVMPKLKDFSSHKQSRTVNVVISRKQYIRCHYRRRIGMDLTYRTEQSVVEQCMMFFECHHVQDTMGETRRRFLHKFRMLQNQLCMAFNDRATADLELR